MSNKSSVPATHTSYSIRQKIVDVLQLDLIGPDNDHPFKHEWLPQSPQRWYLTGYLLPEDAPPEQKQSGDEEDGLDQPYASGEPGAFLGEPAPKQQGKDDPAPNGAGDDNPEPEPSSMSFLPSSIGLSALVPPETTAIKAIIHWGDYLSESDAEEETELDEVEVDQAWDEEVAAAIKVGSEEEEVAEAKDKPKRIRRGYRREPRCEEVRIQLDGSGQLEDQLVPNARGLKVAASWHEIGDLGSSRIQAGTKMISVFLVNGRKPTSQGNTYREIAFQVEIELVCEQGFVGRPDLRGLRFPEDSDSDERIADLHYRDVLEYAVGHGVSVSVDEQDGTCHSVRTTWIPSGEIPRTDHSQDVPVLLDMEKLGTLADGETAKHELMPLVVTYRKWIEAQTATTTGESLTEAQDDTVEDLAVNARYAAERIESGIQRLADDPVCLEAFLIANRAMALQARQRFSQQKGVAPDKVDAPRWRLFQLAFILMNLDGLTDPSHPSRKTVDLLFFPTGGGKTEAYLGLAAFTLVLRRLRNPGIESAGVSIIMRYTLRLLTLDQLGRAAALMCALELERAGNPALGDWPFEIGLWVGSGATPNRMGKAADDGPGKERTAYTKLTRYKNQPLKHACPIPIESCPWCGTRFTPDSFTLEPDQRLPSNLRVSCDNIKCHFSAAQDRFLPILGVDEPIYRRLPCFLIATVDKFAALPWTGEVGGLFGKVDRHDAEGFYGPSTPNRGRALPGGSLLPPDLIIQDELHLISGPLGTVAGIYETVIESLCRQSGDAGLLPKIVASTATVRRADRQIRALFGRHETAIFPPPGPDRRHNFFSFTVKVTDENPGRLYLGISAKGRSMKVVYLRTALALLAGAAKLYREAGGPVEGNPCDPYMTMLCYFNSLRELGGTRRIVEDEVYAQAQARFRRYRHEPDDRLFVDRYIKRNPVELTSRVDTDDVAAAKRRLESDFADKSARVDVALATNMISVGLDIVRLGLMVVMGQPKTSSEYIQATSRVGRDGKRPGLVITLLNIHKPRDRSHYERFTVYHRTFYRAVEASSVTPFSIRALDRAMAGALVGLCRHSVPGLSAAVRAGSVGEHLNELQRLVSVFRERALTHDAYRTPEELAALASHVDNLAQSLIAKWLTVATQSANEGIGLSYQKFEGPKQNALVRDFLDADFEFLPTVYQHFRANRSMRDVETAVDIIPKQSSIGTNI